MRSTIKLICIVLATVAVIVAAVLGIIYVNVPNKVCED